ncbi:hypothetical protein AQ482_19515 [Acinetobacter baumannii]|nr:hypothetical protein AQ482_19515 [Acinetobacter baumannii]
MKPEQFIREYGAEKAREVLMGRQFKHLVMTLLMMIISMVQTFKMDIRLISVKAAYVFQI